MTRSTQRDPIRSISKIFPRNISPVKSGSFVDWVKSANTGFSHSIFYPSVDSVVSNIISFPLMVFTSFFINAHLMILTFSGTVFFTTVSPKIILTIKTLQDDMCHRAKMVIGTLTRAVLSVFPTLTSFSLTGMVLKNRRTSYTFFS